MGEEFGLDRQSDQRPKSDRLTPKALQAVDGGRSYSWVACDLGISKNAVADNVKRPRIPMVADFEAFAEAGKRQAELHLGYETGEEYPLEVLFEGLGELRPEQRRIGKRAMRFVDGERAVLVVNDRIRLAGIPAEAHDY